MDYGLWSGSSYFFFETTGFGGALIARWCVFLQGCSKKHWALSTRLEEIPPPRLTQKAFSWLGLKSYREG